MHFAYLSHPRESKKFGIHQKVRIRLKACEDKLAGYFFHKGFTISDILEQVNLALVKKKRERDPRLNCDRRRIMLRTHWVPTRMRRAEMESSNKCWSSWEGKNPWHICLSKRFPYSTQGGTLLQAKSIMVTFKLFPWRFQKRCPSWS